MHPIIRITALILAVVIIPLTGLLYFSLGKLLSPTAVGSQVADGPLAVFSSPNAVGILFIITVVLFGIGAMMIRAKIKRDQADAAPLTADGKEDADLTEGE